MSNSLREEWAEVCAERDKLREENARLHHEVSLRNSELIHVATGNWRLPCGCSAGMTRIVSCGASGHRVGTACGHVVKAQLEAARPASGTPAIPQPAPGVQTTCGCSCHSKSDHPEPGSECAACGHKAPPDVQAALAALVGFVRYVACPVCSYDVRIENGIIRGHRYKGEWCSTSRGLLVDAVRDAGRKS